MNRSKVISLVITLLLFSIVILTVTNSPSVMGIIKLQLSNQDIVEIEASSTSHSYMSKSTNGDRVIADLMENKGFNLVDKQGSSYFFENKYEKVIVSKKIYAKAYIIWKMEPYGMEPSPK